MLEIVEEKFEHRLTEEIGKVNERMSSDIGKLDTKIERTKADLIKWMFIFWIGQIGAIMGLLFAFLNKLI